MNANVQCIENATIPCHCDILSERASDIGHDGDTQLETFQQALARAVTDGTILCIQPASIEPALLMRFGDCMLKYLMADKIIAPGGCYKGADSDASGQM